MRTPKDWELMSQKKDIEEIKTILSESTTTRNDTLKKGMASLIMSIISSLAATFLTSWMSESGEAIPCWVYLVVVFAIIFISLIPFLKDLYRGICRRETHTNEEIIFQVNLFDNDIIYNIMLANRYFDLSQDNDISPNEKDFFVSEAKYFIRKIIHQLITIKAISLCNTIDECGYGKNKKILRSRVESSLNFVIYILNRIGDDSFFSVTNKDIEYIITCLGLNKDAVYQNVKFVK